MVVAGQAGRPLHDTVFRDPRVGALAAAAGSSGGLGWPAEYVYGAGSEELEAERLFDHAMLAPAEPPGALGLD